MDRTRRVLIGGLAAAPLTVVFGPKAGAQAPATQVTGLRHFPVGSGVVTALLDGYLEIGADAFSDLSQEDASALLEQAFWPAGPVPTGINCFLYRDGERVVLIDAGGAGAFPSAGRLSQVLSATDVAPEDVDTVLLTHLHPDHIGGLVMDGEPVFGNADALVHEDEVAFWTSDQNRAGAPDSSKPFFDMASGAVEAYRDRLTTFSGEVEVIPGVHSLLLPGHTPGHTGYVIGQGDDALTVWGDIVHVGAFQFPRPEAAIGFDVDPEQAVETRRAIFRRAADEQLRVAGMHLSFPGVGRLRRAGEGYAFEPERWSYDLG